MKRLFKIEIEWSIEKLLKGQKMLIKELKDIKSQVLKLKEELERLKKELLTVRIMELRQRK